MPFGPSDDGDEVVDDVGIRGAREAGGQDGPGQDLAGLGIRDCQAPGEQVPRAPFRVGEQQDGFDEGSLMIEELT